MVFHLPYLQGIKRICNFDGIYTTSYFLWNTHRTHIDPKLEYNCQEMAIQPQLFTIFGEINLKKQLSSISNAEFQGNPLKKLAISVAQLVRCMPCPEDSGLQTAVK